MYEAFERLLLKNNVTASTVARKTGIAPSTLSEWKHNKSIPKTDKLIKIADYFGVDINYFLDSLREKNKQQLNSTTKS